MQKFKRFMGVALAATMVAGSSITALADDPVTSGSTIGTGTSEGHVDTHVINVVLPTIAEGSTPFAYTMDAERLIQGTEGAKYTNATFPDAASDTGVYFLTGMSEATTTYTKKDAAPDTYTDGDFDTLPANPDADAYNALTDAQKTCYDVTQTPAGATYANTSEALKVTSKSSADVKLTVEVEAASAATDITLVDAAPAADVTDPQLYLALNVGSTTKAIKKGEKVSQEVTIAGKDDNFETTVDNGAYVYAEKEVAEGQPELTWNEESISLTGAVSKASAKDLTAPELTVTWKYEDPAETPEVVEPEEIFSFTELAADKNEVVVNGVASDATVNKVVVKRKNGTDIDITANTTGASTVSWLTKEGGNGELIFKVSATIITNANNAGATIEVEFSDGKKGTLTIPE